MIPTSDRWPIRIRIERRNGVEVTARDPGGLAWTLYLNQEAARRLNEGDVVAVDCIGGVLSFEKAGIPLALVAWQKGERTK